MIVYRGEAEDVDSGSITAVSEPLIVELFKPFPKVESKMLNKGSSSITAISEPPIVELLKLFPNVESEMFIIELLTVT